MRTKSNSKLTYRVNTINQIFALTPLIFAIIITAYTSQLYATLFCFKASTFADLYLVRVVHCLGRQYVPSLRTGLPD